MKGRLHYVSPKGSAEMVATAIGNEVNMIKEALPPAYMPENVILMFLGCEGGKADKVTNSPCNDITIALIITVMLLGCTDHAGNILGNTVLFCGTQFISHDITLLPRDILYEKVSACKLQAITVFM